MDLSNIDERLHYLNVTLKLLHHSFYWEYCTFQSIGQYNIQILQYKTLNTVLL